MRFSHLNGLIDNHDIVMVGYRGVDGSVVLDCPEVAEALKGIGNDLVRRFDSRRELDDGTIRCGTPGLRERASR